MWQRDKVAVDRSRKKKNPGRTEPNGDEGQSREKWQEESLIQKKPYSLGQCAQLAGPCSVHQTALGLSPSHKESNMTGLWAQSSEGGVQLIEFLLSP